jgi:hypothetical protein
LSVLCKPRLIVPLIAVVVSCVLAGPIVATASASDTTIIKTVNHWSPIIGKDENKIAAAEHAFKLNRKAPPVIKSLKNEVGDLTHFAKQLKAQSASTSTGAKGRDDIAKGTLIIAGAYSQFAAELKRHPQGLSKQQIRANQKIARKGHKKIVAGVTLLQRLA